MKTILCGYRGLEWEQWLQTTTEDIEVEDRRGRTRLAEVNLRVDPK